MTRVLFSIRWIFFWNVCLLAIGATGAAPELEPGLKVAFATEGGDRDVVTRPNARLYVVEGESPTPFLAPGPFSATWIGFLSLDLRSEYRFHTRFRGELTLELNGAELLRTNSAGNDVVISKPVRLNKGTNSFKLTLQSPGTGDTMLRLEWAARGGLPFPIPDSALLHSSDSELTDAADLHLGRELVIEHRCAKCHAAAGAEKSPDLEMDAPSFEGIGGRRDADWLARWIANPKQERPSARMPRIFQGAASELDARAIAAYLSTLKSSETNGGYSLASEDSGKQLFTRLQCAACHVPPGSDEKDPLRLPLDHVRQKFAAGALARFLLEPEAQYRWIRMPNFNLTREQAASLAAYLDGHAVPRKPENSATGSTGSAEPGDKVVGRGKELVATSGCLNCHTGPGENRFVTKPFEELARSANKGCLSETPLQNSNTPYFGFSETERHAVAKYIAGTGNSLKRFVRADFAERQVRQARCGDCHGKFDGFPPLPLLGGKLKPEWSAKFIGGEVPYKPRPWLAARMPAFKQPAGELAQGLAMLHGFPPRSIAEPEIDEQAAEMGRQLVSAVGGLSCNACHGIANMPATQVFEGAGINLSYSADRLLKSYYQHWLLNPLAIDPTTKMPAYFDEEGRSPLTEFYDGDGLKQIDAIWEYIRMGERMPAPPTQ